MEGRRFISDTPELGECCSCGGKSDEYLAFNKVVKSKFSDFGGLLKTGGVLFCEGCIALLDNKAGRSKMLICENPGELRISDKSEAMQIIENPPDKFFLSIPYSFKKHHWLYAGLSTKDLMLIGTDNKTVVYEPIRHRDIKNALNGAINLGVPTMQILNGTYHPSTYQKFGASYITKLEDQIACERPTGLVELLLKLIPKPVTKEKIEMEDMDDMLDDIDKSAAAFLGQVAEVSQLRRDRSQDFWGGIFLRRVQRFSRCTLPDMLERLAATLRISTTDMSSIAVSLDSMFDEDAEQIRKAIEKHPRLIVAIAYDILKVKRGNKK